MVKWFRWDTTSCYLTHRYERLKAIKRTIEEDEMQLRIFQTDTQERVWDSRGGLVPMTIIDEFIVHNDEKSTKLQNLRT